MKKILTILMVALSVMMICPSCKSQSKNTLCRSQLELLGAVENERYDKDGNLIECLINDGNATFTVSFCDEILYDDERAFNPEDISTPYLNEFTPKADWQQEKGNLKIDGAIYRYTAGIGSESCLWLIDLYLPIGEGSYARISYCHEYMWMYAYPADGSPTFMTRLLQTQAAADAVAEWNEHCCVGTKK